MLRRIFNINLALMEVREHLYLTPKAIRQRWKEIRIRLALVFALLYAPDQTKLSEQIKHWAGECEDVEPIAPDWVVTVPNSIIENEDRSKIERWLDRLDCEIMNIYHAAGYAYIYCQQQQYYRQTPLQTEEQTVEDADEPMEGLPEP